MQLAANKIFICYNPKNRKYRDRLLTFLKPLATKYRLDLWSDQQIPAGGDRLPAIDAALAESAIAVLIVTADFLESLQGEDKELLAVFDARKNRGLHVMPVRFSPCGWEHEPRISTLQTLPRDKRAISQLKDREQALQDVCSAIDKHFEDHAGGIIVHGIPEEELHHVKRPALLSRLFDAVEKGAVLVVLAGQGGAGKTTLAMAFARQRHKRFVQVVRVDVREGGGGSAAVAQSLLSALGKSDSPVANAKAGLSLLNAQLDEFARRKQNVLVILDNADYPGDDLEDFVDALAGMKGCCVLVTTRMPDFGKKLRAYANIEVGKFEASEAISCLKYLLDEGERCDDEAALLAVARIVELVPLWVQLAGRHMRRYHVSPSEYVKGEGAFEQLRKKLSKEVDSLLIACGACAATGFTVVAAARASGLDESRALAGLEQLQELSVVIARSEKRFALHPLLREMVRKESGFAEAADRHGAWVLDQMGTERREIKRVEAVKEEVMAAVQNTEVTKDTKRLVALCLQAMWYWRNRGPWTFAETAFDRAGNAASENGDEAALSQMLFARGETLRQSGDWDGALARFEEKAKLDERRRAPCDQVLALTSAGVILRMRGEFAAARRKFKKALHLNEALDPGGRDVGVLLNKLGALEYRAGNHAAGLRYCERSLKISQKVGNNAEEAAALNNIGDGYARRNEHREALAMYEKSLSIQRDLNLPVDIAGTLNLKGISHAALGEMEEAESCYGESLRISEQEVGHALWTASNLFGLGELRIQQKRFVEAREFLDKALPLYARMGYQDRVGECRSLLAQCA